jgi:microcystin-dependent protein
MSGVVRSGGGLPVGSYLFSATGTFPAGYLACAGQNVSRATYAALFAKIGTTYGAGDGSTTFGIPDCRGRAPFGKDDMGGSAASRITAGNSGINGATLGAAGGDERLHAHTHSGGASSIGVTGGGDNGAKVGTTGSTGAGASQNMPPAIIVNWGIKY